MADRLTDAELEAAMQGVLPRGGVAMAVFELIERRAMDAEIMDELDNALGVLLGCCVPAGGVDDKAAILDAQRGLSAMIAKLKESA